MIMLDTAITQEKSCDIPALRDALRRDRLALQERFLLQGKASWLLAAHSKLIDQYLRNIWAALSLPETCALIAVGGYGRGELYPSLELRRYWPGERRQLKSANHQANRSGSSRQSSLWFDSPKTR